VLGVSNAQCAQGNDNGSVQSGSSSSPVKEKAAKKQSTGSKGSSGKGSSTTVVSKEDNSQHNGQGSGGLIGIGIDALNE
jgi:hypothetical protein